MSLGRYMALKLVVSLGVFLCAVPLFFLLAGVTANALPTSAQLIVLLFPGLPFVIGMAVVSHILTEKLSKRWSR